MVCLYYFLQFCTLVCLFVNNFAVDNYFTPRSTPLINPMSVKKRIRCTAQQLKMLTEYMQTHPRLARGEFSGPQGQITEKRQWEELRAMLSEDGPDKSIDHWKVTWRDLRRKARTEGSVARQAARSTGNATEVPVVTAQTKKILDIMGTEEPFAIQGHEESGTWCDLQSKSLTEGSVARRAAKSTGNATEVPLFTAQTKKNLDMGTEGPLGIQGHEESGRFVIITTPTVKRTMKRKASSIDDDPQIKITNVRNEPSRNKEMTEFEAFAISVARKLERMDPVQAIHAETIIQAALRKGLLNRLTESTDICDKLCNKII